jgi:hypothetical protein
MVTQEPFGAGEKRQSPLLNWHTKLIESFALYISLVGPNRPSGALHAAGGGWGMSKVGTKSRNSMFSQLIERIRQALHHKRKKQFQEKNLCEIVVPNCIYLSNEIKPAASSSLFLLLVPTVLTPHIHTNPY